MTWFCAACIGMAVFADAPSDFVTGKTFETAIARPISATWENVDLRTVTRRVSGQLKVSVLVDRRLDPSHEIAMQAAAERPIDVLNRVAAPLDAHTSVVGNVV